MSTLGGLAFCIFFRVYSGVLHVIWAERGGQARASGKQGMGNGRVGWLSTMLTAQAYCSMALSPVGSHKPTNLLGSPASCLVSLFTHTHTLSHTHPPTCGAKIIALFFFIFSIDGAGGTSFSTYLCCSFYLFVSTASKESNRMLRWFCSHTHARNFLMILLCSCET